MRSSDDELNDAIKTALKAQFGNFQCKPKASLDERIYLKLGQKPDRKPLWAMLAVAALVGLLGLWFVNDSQPIGVSEKTKPATGNTAEKPQTAHKQYEVNRRDNVVDISAKAPSNINNDQRNLPTNEVTDTPEEERESENRAGYVADDHVLAGKSDHQHYVLHDRNDAYQVEELDLLDAAKYPPLPLPLITLPVLQDNADSVNTEIAEKKPAVSWKPSMLVNVSLTNTSQHVYLLPSTHSRVLKVSFPNSIGNIGYKIGIGMHAKNVQLLLNYSHLQYQTQYVYASDEFTAEPANASYHFKRLGTARTVKSAFDIIGVAAKKNIDFETKALGALYAQFGMEYSRSMTGPNQQLLSASASAGKRIFTGSKASVMIGPFFEYNILRIVTSEENVKIRPNQVGLSLGLRFSN